MGFLGNHPGYTEAAATLDSVAALVGQMQTELRGLMSRRADLVRRGRNLRRLMRGLREISSAPFTPLAVEPPSPAGHKSATPSFPLNRTAIEESGRRLPSGVQHRTEHVNVQLQRACRIALLEAENPMSLEEIFTRIVRRGSFSFVNPECANPLLLQVLNAMAEDGEVNLLESAPCWRWQRVAPLNDD